MLHRKHLSDTVSRKSYELFPWMDVLSPCCANLWLLSNREFFLIVDKRELQAGIFIQPIIASLFIDACIQSGVNDTDKNRDTVIREVSAKQADGSKHSAGEGGHQATRISDVPLWEKWLQSSVTGSAEQNLHRSQILLQTVQPNP